MKNKGTPLYARAFTLTELMIVVVIVGVIAGFAIPNYTRAVERAHLRDAVVQLTTVHAANQIYRAENEKYWPLVSGQDLAAINAALSLSIIANGMTYTCGGVLAGTSFTCTAVRDPPAASFTVTVTEAPVSSSNPSCTAGACP